MAMRTIITTTTRTASCTTVTALRIRTRPA
jgi:hypothetical protein